jgi:ligand-binding SRPBCC domain-containing protein
MGKVTFRVFRTSMSLPLPRGEAFVFFADAANLGRLFGALLRWQTRTTNWEPSTGFVDEQVRGPYRLWKHTHRFCDGEEATIIEDTGYYRLPFAPGLHRGV